MLKNRRLWDTASRLLSDPDFFESQRNKTLESHPLLNSRGLGFPLRSQRGDPIRKAEELTLLEAEEAHDFETSRDALRSGGRFEQGIRNTLEYFVDGRISLSYRLRGCAQPKRFNGPAPPKTSSYRLRHSVESYLRERDRRTGKVKEEIASDRYTANGAFICAALMVGLKIWTYKGSIHPDLRIGEPWAVAGLQPEDYVRPREEVMARFWRWVVQLDQNDPVQDDFIADTIDLLYSGANLERLRFAILRADEPARSTYQDLILEFRDGSSRRGKQNEKARSRIGSLLGEIEIPDDFNEMGAEEITSLFEGKA
ncbi:MAG: hypothetical protein OXG15_05960 [Gammaproteobacteria bacterium]|nr:hypothetical protein [Gammaproteobacteria bacterium]